MQIQYRNYSFDLSKPIDISIAIKNGNNNPKAFYGPDTILEPVRTDEFVGSTTEGGILNFKNVFLNPHGNGTHTECLGHITENEFTINQCLKEFHHLAQVVSITPETLENGDTVISEKQVKAIDFHKDAKAIIIRTLPNSEDKNSRDWSGANHTYIHHLAMKHMVDSGIEHFMIDSPSVDREDDNGMLLAHKTFWGLLNEKTQVKGAVKVDDSYSLERKNCTITEMIFVPNEIKDDLYLMNIQIISLEMDASPSKILLFEKK
ncbi:MAG: arylformamidase [Planctomycetota bacterium]|jgi:arylformamidase